jgi:predicted nucleic acid-binding Zn ribbon protein
MRFCSNCGKEINDDEKFCPSCGTAVSKSTVPPNIEKKSSTRSKQLKIVGTVVVIIIIIGLLIAFLPSILRFSKNVIDDVGETVTPTNFEIINHNIRTQTQGLDYVAYVDVTVHNHGGEGTEVIWCQVTQGNDQWKQSMLLELGSQESKSLTFTFSEVSFWTNADIHSTVWIG